MFNFSEAEYNNMFEFTSKLNSNNSEFLEFISGSKKFYSHNYEHNLKAPKIIWKSGHVELLYYPGGRNKILFVPSILNKYHILDLKKGKSLARYLAQNFSVYMINWSSEDQDISKFEDYIFICGEIIKFLSKNNDKIRLIGYCLGGLIALAACKLYQNHIGQLALIATPWDFSKLTIVNKFVSDESYQIFQNVSRETKISNFLIRSLFIMLHYKDVFNKYILFNSMSKKSDKDLFVHVEHWLSDVSLIKREIILYIIKYLSIYNYAYEKEWKINEIVIDPCDIMIPVLIIIAKRDKIVPKESTYPLIDIIENRQVIEVDSGHIGMIIGRNSKEELWQPLKNWFEPS